MEDPFKRFSQTVKGAIPEQDSDAEKEGPDAKKGLDGFIVKEPAKKENPKKRGRSQISKPASTSKPGVTAKIDQFFSKDTK